MGLFKRRFGKRNQQPVTSNSGEPWLPPTLKEQGEGETPNTQRESQSERATCRNRGPWWMDWLTCGNGVRREAIASISPLGSRWCLPRGHTQLHTWVREAGWGQWHKPALWLYSTSSQCSNAFRKAEGRQKAGFILGWGLVRQKWWVNK